MIMEIAKLSEKDMEPFCHYCSDFLNDCAYIFGLDANEIPNVAAVLVPDDAAWGRIETVIQSAFKYIIESKGDGSVTNLDKTGLPNWWDAIGALVYARPGANPASQLKITQEIYRGQPTCDFVDHPAFVLIRRPARDIYFTLTLACKWLMSIIRAKSLTALSIVPIFPVSYKLDMEEATFQSVV
jgi:hypothetical protein